MTKWAGILSTTEPYNHLGTIPVRQGNKNSEIFEFKIVENGIPYDLTGYRVFFCVHFDPYISVEKNAVIVDAKKGIIRFVMDDDCMQKVGNQEGYFEIYKEDTFLDATQYFTYKVQPSIIKQLMDGESYIQRLEELFKKLQEAMDKSQEEVEKWLEENRQKIDDLMNEMDRFFADKKNEFSAWFESVREILESIDPGGILLSEITRARSSDRYGTFNTLDDRLEEIESIITSDAKLVTIKHDFNQYPHAVLTMWEKGLGVTGIGTKTAFGSLPKTIPMTIGYQDDNNLEIYVPHRYAMENPVLTKVSDTSYLITENEGRGIRVRLFKEGY